MRQLRNLLWLPCAFVMILCEFVVEVQNWFGLELGFLYLLLSKAQAGTEAYFNDCPLLFYTGYCSSCFTGVRVPLHFFTFFYLLELGWQLDISGSKLVSLPFVCALPGALLLCEYSTVMYECPFCVVEYLFI